MRRSINYLSFVFFYSGFWLPLEEPERFSPISMVNLFIFSDIWGNSFNFLFSSKRWELASFKFFNSSIMLYPFSNSVKFCLSNNSDLFTPYLKFIADWFLFSSSYFFTFSSKLIILWNDSCNFLPILLFYSFNPSTCFSSVTGYWIDD